MNRTGRPGAAPAGFDVLIVKEVGDLPEGFSLLPFREDHLDDLRLVRVWLYVFPILRIAVTERANPGGLVSLVGLDGSAPGQLKGDAHALVNIQGLHNGVDQVIIGVFAIQVIFRLLDADELDGAFHHLPADDGLCHVRSPEAGSVQHNNSISFRNRGEQLHKPGPFADRLVIIRVFHIAGDASIPEDAFQADIVSGYIIPDAVFLGIKAVSFFALGLGGDSAISVIHCMLLPGPV